MKTHPSLKQNKREGRGTHRKQQQTGMRSSQFICCTSKKSFGENHVRRLNISVHGLW